MSLLALGAMGAAGSIGSSLASGLFGAAEARKNRKFQERMATTKYQYTMADMRKAGLNPMLAYSQGAGAAPGGATGAAQFQNPAHSAVSVGKEGAIAKNVKATTNNIQQDTILKSIQGVQGLERAKLDQLQQQLLGFQLNSAKNVSDIAGGRAGPALRWVNEISKALQGARGATVGSGVLRRRR